jgi:hypothetical protein
MSENVKNNTGRRFDSKAAADHIGVASQTMNNWRYRRQGPVYHKVGDKIFYYENDLDDFIKAGRIDPNDRS